MTENLHDTNDKRTPIFKALVGSHNYNLNTPESDKDYKLFVLPIFDDLYSGIEYTYSMTSDNEDITTSDIRKLSSLFYKSSINSLEILYSKELEILLPKEHKSYTDIESIFSNRENICKMNMPYLYQSSKGIFNSYRKTMLNKEHKSYNKTLGYSPKQAMNAYRAMDFLSRYKHFIRIGAEHPFSLAMNYFYENDKYELLNIKKGIYSLEQINAILDAKYNRTVVACEQFYLNQELDKEMLLWLNNKLKKIVKDNM